MIFSFGIELDHHMFQKLSTGICLQLKLYTNTFFSIYLHQTLCLFYRNLTGFLVFNYMKTWNGKRLPNLTTVSTWSLIFQWLMDYFMSIMIHSILLYRLGRHSGRISWWISWSTVRMNAKKIFQKKSKKLSSILVLRWFITIETFVILFVIILF